jgi:hypothetical protein
VVGKSEWVDFGTESEGKRSRVLIEDVAGKNFKACVRYSNCSLELGYHFLQSVNATVRTCKKA